MRAPTPVRPPERSRGGAGAAPALYECVISHARVEPVRHAFRHRTYMWLVDLDHLPRLPRVLRPLARFDPRDHLAGTQPTIRAGLERYLTANGVSLDGGRVVMLAHARTFGYVFNPLTVYWCHDRDGVLRCVVAEVHNTYGERHCYLMRTDAQGRALVPKEFYVSPFQPVEGAYRMRLPEPGERLELSVQLVGAGPRPFTATVRGRRRPATARQVVAAALRHPWSTAAVSVGIRRHGIHLYLRGVPVHPRPHHPRQEGLT